MMRNSEDALENDELPTVRVADLHDRPDVLAALTGLTPDEFAGLVAQIEPAAAYALRARRASRPGRKHRPGAGRPFVLSLPDQVLAVLMVRRFDGHPYAAGCVLGVSEVTVRRTVKRLVPLIR